MSIKQKSVLLFPIRVLLLWNIFTILLFIFSPYEWGLSVRKYALLLLLLTSSLFFLYVGYVAGLRSSLKFHYNPPANILSRWFTISLFVKAIWFLPYYCDRLGLNLFDFKTMFLRLALGFTDFGESYSYNQGIEYENSGFSPLFLLKQTLVAITSLTIPLGIILWRKLGLIKKTAIVIFIVTDVVFWMGIGTNVGVVNNFLTIFFMIVVTHPNLASLSTIKFKHKLYILTILVLLLSLFSLNVSQRHDYSTNDQYNVYEDRIGTARIDKNNFWFRVTHPSVHGTIISVSNYLNQGYYHTTMAFDEDFTWTYGLGNNYATLGVSKKVVGANLLPMTYVGKIEKKGVEPFQNWHSAYLWFANDFTFFGVPVVFFLIGLLFSISWKSTLKLNDPFAPVLFLFCVFEVFYLCANNQVLSFSFFAFHIVVLLRILNFYIYAKRRASPVVSG